MSALAEMLGRGRLDHVHTLLYPFLFDVAQA